MLRQVDPISALKAGVLGTAVMTLFMYGLPIIGLPSMDIMAALGSVFPLRISPYIPGFFIHFGIGIALALIYGAFFHCWLPGPNWLKGLLFSLLPWLFAITLLGPSLQLASQLFGAQSSTSTTNPCAVANPCAVQKANPCAPKSVNPCSPANPCLAKPQTNPCAPPPNPCAPKPVNPCAPKAVNPCAAVAASQGNIPPQVLSLIVHLIYGGIVGALYRPRP